ncbi:MAG: GNAT family N-acetyltransferase [Candidatus Peregrinibacteria bacterium]|nr:GNAT family N-acetyltransferase [Candidatus Peregrinibacteria bacterium]MDZ4245274.1 GNAT family N-acetyltransferase [Candidatus Gracilibacteria bacterium]
MRLVKPTKKYEKSWQEAMAEFRNENRKGFWNWIEEPIDLDSYIKLTEANENGQSLTVGSVASTTFWLIDNNEFKGHTNIRHELNDYLKKFGGHIGYYIRPSERRKGYGTKILGLALIEARKIGLKKVMIGCDESNIPSQKVIEKNGGEFTKKVTDECEPKLIYWIKL